MNDRKPRLNGLRCLVTGGAGFVGCRLVERLLLDEQAESVRCVIRQWHKATWVSRTTAELVGGDVTDLESIRAAADGAEVIFHCASGGSNREQYFAVNESGTRNVMTVALEMGIPVVHISTVAVHGPVLPELLNEESPMVSTGKAYGESKIAGENVVKEFSNRVHSTIIRPTFVWGPRSHLFTVIPLKKMVLGSFRYIDRGEGRCHAVHVDNLVESMICAWVTQSTRQSGRAYLVTDDIPDHRWKDFFDPLADWLDKECIATVVRKSVSSKSRCISRLAALKIRLDERLAALAGSPAPTHRRVRRRSIREAGLLIERLGVPPLWDLAKYSQHGEIDLSRAKDELQYQSVLAFEDAIRETLQWSQWYLADELRSLDGAI